MEKLAIQDENLNAFLKCYADAIKAMGWREARAVNAIIEARKLASRVDPKLLSEVDLIGREGGLGWLGSTQEAQRELGALCSDVARAGGFDWTESLCWRPRHWPSSPNYWKPFWTAR